MTEIELDICGKGVTFFYVMSQGEISKLLMLVSDNETMDAGELLALDHVYNAIDDHYANMMLEANIES